LLLLAVAVLIGLHTAYWRWASGRLEAGYAAWVQARIAAGWTVQAGPPVRDGWPLAATLTLPQAAIRIPDTAWPGNGASWQADRVVLRLALFNPTRLQIEPGGAQWLQLGIGPAMPISADRLRLELPLLTSGTRSVTLAAGKLRVGLPWLGGNLDIVALQVNADLLPPALGREPAASFHLAARTIGLPPERVWPLGPAIASVALDGTVDLPLPQAGSVTARAAQWRDGGGGVKLTQIALAWGKLDLTGTAALLLDDTLQPSGTATLRAAGFVEAIDALFASGWITEQSAALAKMILTVMARPSEQPDHVTMVEMPLVVQSRAVSMRRITLLRLPVLAWPPH
jgi:hypothetical protein